MLGHVTLAHLLVGQGKWRSAKQELLVAQSLDPLNALVFDAILSSAPFLPVPPRIRVMPFADFLLFVSLLMSFSGCLAEVVIQVGFHC